MQRDSSGERGGRLGAVTKPVASGAPAPLLP